jgi:hypothetical protein
MYEKHSTNPIFIAAAASILYNNWWEQFGVADTLLALFSTSAFAIHMKDIAVSSFSSPDSSLRLHLFPQSSHTLSNHSYKMASQRLGSILSHLTPGKSGVAAM